MRADFLRNVREAHRASGQIGPNTEYCYPIASLRRLKAVSNMPDAVVNLKGLHLSTTISMAVGSLRTMVTASAMNSANGMARGSVP
jgi:hypothetical protein